jgi:hypothetical protein
MCYNDRQTGFVSPQRHRLVALGLQPAPRAGAVFLTPCSSAVLLLCTQEAKQFPHLRDLGLKLRRNNGGSPNSLDDPAAANALLISLSAWNMSPACADREMNRNAERYRRKAESAAHLPCG